MLEVHSVQNKVQIAQWHEVTRTIYADYPQFVLHLQKDIEGLFHPKTNRLLNEGVAQRWIVLQNGRCAGRVAAFWNRKYSDGQTQKTGGIGFFESFNQEEVARLLLQTAEDYLRDKGVLATYRKMIDPDLPFQRHPSLHG